MMHTLKRYDYFKTFIKIRPGVATMKIQEYAPHIFAHIRHLNGVTQQLLLVELLWRLFIFKV